MQHNAKMGVDELGKILTEYDIKDAREFHNLGLKINAKKNIDKRVRL